jgi:uncharacterized membrane protein YraQ (UPF0718 family)
MDIVTLIRVISGVVVCFFAVIVIIRIRRRRAPNIELQGKTQPQWGYIATPVLLYSLAYVLGPVLHGWNGDAGWGDNIADFIGSISPVLFFSALIAYLIRGWKGDWRGFSRWFFWLGIFMPAMAFLAMAYFGSLM